MTPAAKAALTDAVMTAQTLTPRINNALIRARHRADGDRERLEQLAIARSTAAELIEVIGMAELALKRNRREDG